MANTDNKINIGDAWKDMDSVQINIGDVWKDVSDAWINVGDSWKQWWSGIAVGDRGVFGGGHTGLTQTNTLDYIAISVPAEGCTDFGDLTQARDYISATSNGSTGRGIFVGGYNGSVIVNTIDFINIDNPTGGCTDWGDLSGIRRGVGSTSNGTNDRGIFGGGTEAISVNIIEYCTISVPSNITDWGDLTQARTLLAACSNGTNERGVFGGGYTATFVNTMDYCTISTPAATATDFGDLTQARSYISATSNSTNERGIFAGGFTGSLVDTIDFINISTPAGGCTDWGDLTTATRGIGTTSNGTNERGVFGGGTTSAGAVSTIDYCTISTPSTVSNFGSLTESRIRLGACSNA